MKTKIKTKVVEGGFRLKNSPYPDLFVKDYPENAATLAYLDNVYRYHTNGDIVSNMSQSMLNGIKVKMERCRTRLRYLKHGTPHDNAFFIFSAA